METTAQKLTKLAGIKESIRQAIVAKGFELSEGASFAEYAVALGGAAPSRNGNIATTQDRLVYIEAIKEAIRLAIASYGVDIPASTPFGVYPEKIAEITIKEPEAFAVYSADDGSFNFYKRGDVPSKGSQFEGKTATEVYTDIENTAFQFTKDVPWASVKENVSSVTFVNEIKPTNMRLWFYGMSNCTSMNFDKLDTSSVIDMSYMLHSCSSMTSFNIGGFDTSNVTSFNLMFKSCSSLVSVSGIENWNVENVSNMGDMFGDCSSLKSIDLSGWNTPSLTMMSYMFLNCTSLEEIDMSSWNNANVGDSNMLRTFSECSKLRLIKLSDKFAWKKTDATFILPTPSSSNIPEADGKWYDIETGIGYVPADVPSNKAATYVAVIPKGFAVYSADDNSLNFYKREAIPSQNSQFEGKTATQVYQNIESITPASTSNVPWSSYRTRITSVTFVDEVKPVSMKYWFYEFKNCETMDLLKLNTSAVTDMSYAFRYCSKLTYLYLGSFDTSNVTNFKLMFESCTLLGEVGGTDEWNVSNVVDMSNMFYGCSKLSSVSFKGWNTSSLTNMSYMLYGCENLEILYMNNWDTSNVAGMYRSFYECDRLQVINLGEKFAWINAASNYILPTPSSTYIPGADGGWYNSVGVRFYPVTQMPSNVADTYYASKDLVPDTFKNVTVTMSGENTVRGEVNLSGYPDGTVINYQWYESPTGKDGTFVIRDGDTKYFTEFGAFDMNEYRYCLITLQYNGYIGNIKTPVIELDLRV